MIQNMQLDSSNKFAFVSIISKIDKSTMILK